MCSEERARLRADAGTSRLIVFVWRLLICAPCDPPDGPSLQTWDPSRLNLVPTLSLQQLGDCLLEPVPASGVVRAGPWTIGSIKLAIKGVFTPQ